MRSTHIRRFCSLCFIISFHFIPFGSVQFGSVQHNSRSCYTTADRKRKTHWQWQTKTTRRYNKVLVQKMMAILYCRFCIHDVYFDDNDNNLLSNYQAYIIMVYILKAKPRTNRFFKFEKFHAHTKYLVIPKCNSECICRIFIWKKKTKITKLNILRKNCNFFLYIHWKVQKTTRQFRRSKKRSLLVVAFMSSIRMNNDVSWQWLCVVSIVNACTFDRGLIVSLVIEQAHRTHSNVNT